MQKGKKKDKERKGSAKEEERRRGECGVMLKTVKGARGTNESPLGGGNCGEKLGKSRVVLQWGQVYRKGKKKVGRPIDYPHPTQDREKEGNG